MMRIPMLMIELLAVLTHLEVSRPLKILRPQKKSMVSIKDTVSGVQEYYMVSCAKGNLLVVIKVALTYDSQNRSQW
jgi:hypothetical protein